MNLFPVTVVLPDGTVLPMCRIVADSERVVVWAWDRRVRRPVIAVEGPGPAPRRSNAATFGFVDDTGGEVRVTIGQGCGCHHPLKTFRTPRPVRVG